MNHCTHVYKSLTKPARRSTLFVYMFSLDWNLNVGTVLSVLISATALFVGVVKVFWSAHRENQERLEGIETRMTKMEANTGPVHEWFSQHVIKNWRG